MSVRREAAVRRRREHPRRPQTGRSRAAERELRREGPRRVSAEGETCTKGERSERLKSMAQRRRLRRPQGKLNRSEAEEKRGPVPPPLMLFAFFRLIRSFSEESASSLELPQGKGMAHHLRRRLIWFRRQPVIDDAAIPFSWRVGARLSDIAWRQRRRTYRHRAERGSTGYRSVAHSFLTPPTRARGRGRSGLVAPRSPPGGDLRCSRALGPPPMVPGTDGLGTMGSFENKGIVSPRKHAYSPGPSFSSS